MEKPRALLKNNREAGRRGFLASAEDAQTNPRRHAQRHAEEVSAEDEGSRQEDRREPRSIFEKCSKPAVWKRAIFLSLLLVQSCVTKPVTQEGAPVPGAGGETAGPPPVRGNRVTLVVGGAGIASFALVGMMKKFYEEGIEIEAIVATGWPTLFALGHGYLKSVHDLEWFATRLESKDFDKIGSVDFRREVDPTEALPSIITKTFTQNSLNQSRIPVIIAATNTDLGEPDIFGSGDWKEPLLRTLSVPGLYRDFPTDRGPAWIDGIRGMDVREAQRRGYSNIIAVSAYDDYIQAMTSGKHKDDELIRRLYTIRIRKSVQEASKLAGLFSNIAIGKPPTDFASKRAAQAAGYREASRIIKKIREPSSAAIPADSTSN